MSEVGKIYEAISNVMAEIGAIGKGKKNKQQGFMYRGIDDVMNALQPALVKHKVFIAPEVVNEQREERATQKGGILFYTRLEIIYRFYTIDGSFVETKVIGEAMDSGDKATNKAMSVGYKYACFQIFCIPTEEMKDPDSEVHQVAPKNNKQAQKPKEATQSKGADTPADEVKKIGNQKIPQIKVHALQKELLRTGVSVDSVCERYKVEELADLTEFMFIKAMNGLKKTPTKGE